MGYLFNIHSCTRRKEASFFPLWMSIWILVAVIGSCSTPAAGEKEEEHPTSEKSAAVDTKFLIPDTIVLNTMSLDPAAQAEWIDYSDGIPLQNGRFESIDQAPLNPHFLIFRDSLIQALEEQDTHFLLSHIGDKISMSFDVEQEKAEFIANWNLDDTTATSSIWNVLLETVQTGGLFSSSEFNFFICPYTFLLDVEDPYMQKAIVGTEVRIRDRPGLGATVLGSLNYEVVETLPLNPDESVVEENIGGEIHSWEKVKTSRGIIGYVYGKFLKSPLDFRAFFTFQQDKWILTTFVAGD